MSQICHLLYAITSRRVNHSKQTARCLNVQRFHWKKRKKQVFYKLRKTTNFRLKLCPPGTASRRRLFATKTRNLWSLSELCSAPNSIDRETTQLLLQRFRLLQAFKFCNDVNSLSPLLQSFKTALQTAIYLYWRNLLRYHYELRLFLHWQHRYLETFKSERHAV